VLRRPPDLPRSQCLIQCRYRASSVALDIQTRNDPDFFRRGADIDARDLGRGEQQPALGRVVSKLRTHSKNEIGLGKKFLGRSGRTIDCSLFLAPAGISPTTTTICDRARAAIMSEVPTCVRPGPQVIMASPTRPVVREYASAIATAADLCRAEVMDTSPVRRGSPEATCCRRPSARTCRGSLRQSAPRRALHGLSWLISPVSP
jgi:hypothetical protein